MMDEFVLSIRSYLDEAFSEFEQRELVLRAAGSTAARSLPTVCALAELSLEVAQLLARHGVLACPTFYDLLLRLRPRHAATIAALQASAPAPSGPSAPTTSSTARPPVAPPEPPPVSLVVHYHGPVYEPITIGHVETLNLPRKQ